MSISTNLEAFKTSSRIVYNDKFIGDSGAAQLAHFLANHQNVVSLEIKSNDISGQGFIGIFQALLRNPGLKQLNIEYNNLGGNDYVQWHQALSNLITQSKNLSRLNISNNKITSQGFYRLMNAIAHSTSLKLLQLRYNSINSDQFQQFVGLLKEASNQTLLFVELAGNKIRREVTDALEAILSKNKSKNPITKEKLMGNTTYAEPVQPRTHTQVRSNSMGHIPHDEMTLYLEQILDQTRKDIAENKIRLENELMQLQKRQKLDAVELNQMQKRCNELIIINRNLKFEYDRTISEYEQLQRDQQSHLRVHEEKIRQANKELQDLQVKYEQIQTRMNKEHQLKMKQIVRDWESKLRCVEDKIRMTENDNSLMENQIRKHLEKRERLKIECVEEENIVRNQIEEEERCRFNFTIKGLESKLREIQTTRDGYIHRNQELVLQLERSNEDSMRQIAELEHELEELRAKENQFNAKSKDFFTKNEKIKSEILMKQITIEKLQDQISRLDKQIETKRLAEEEEEFKIKQSNQRANLARESQKQSRLFRLNEVENNLRAAQLENAKLRQEYGLLAQKLQVSLSLAVHKVFQQNSSSL